MSTQKDKKVLASIVSIRAAVLAATGIKMELDELMMILLEEGLIKNTDVRFLRVPDLNKFGEGYVADPTPQKSIEERIKARYEH